jgi:hypothetical protein
MYFSQKGAKGGWMRERERAACEKREIYKPAVFQFYMLRGRGIIRKLYIYIYYFNLYNLEITTWFDKKIIRIM